MLAPWKESMSKSRSVVSDSLRPHGLYSPWNSPGQNTGVGSLSLLQGIFPTQGSNPGLPHCRQILYQLSHKGSPRILEWVAYPFSSDSSWFRNRIRVSCIASGFFTNWAMRESLGRKAMTNLESIFKSKDITVDKGPYSQSYSFSWKFPRTGEPGRLPSIVSHRAGHDWETKHSKWFLQQSHTDVRVGS